MKPVFIALVALGASACGPSVMPVKGGTAEFRFTLSDQVKASPALVDPLLGTVYGNIFLSEDVAVDGPRKDAMQFGAIEVPKVDLRSDKVSTLSFVTPTLAPGLYIFLGFYDVDGNGTVTHDPDPGDPATLALTNKFTITDGVQTKRLVAFEIVFN